MRYGIQDWNAMRLYMPWRTAADYRSTIIRLIRRQAINEYQDIRADPFKIRADNEQAITERDHPDSVVKRGMLVNQNWERGDDERKQIRKANIERYDLPDEEALKVEVPFVMSAAYLQGGMHRAGIARKLKVMALRMEKARRMRQEYTQTEEPIFRVLRGRDVVRHGPGLALAYTYGTDRYIGESPNEQ
jgi:hypothetical protein